MKLRSIVHKGHPGDESMTGFFRRSHATDVQPGYSYTRRHRNMITEKVTVLDLREDALGIPHVRFTVTYESPTADRGSSSLKMLALRSFVDAYRERVA
jgi:hypothetical protein